MKKLFLILMLFPVICFAQTITPIASIQDSLSVYDGEIVTIQGIITIGVGITNNMQMNAFIQDSSGRGIELFDYDISSLHQAELIRGNELEVTGEVDDYNGITELKDLSWSVLSTGNDEPTPIYVELNQYLNDLEGTLVRTVGEITDSWYAGGGNNIIITDQLGFSTTIRIWDSTGIDLDEYEEGYLLEVVGIGGLYSTAFQILPGYQDQLRAGEYDTYPYGDIAEPQAGFATEITFSYPGEFESVILFWKTNEELEFDPVEMELDPARSETYYGDVPAQSAGTKVEFFIISTDSLAVTTLFPIGYPETEAPFDYVIPATKTKAILNVPPKAFNPYNGETFPIEFASKDGDKALLKIYNAEGKLMFQPQNMIITENSGNNMYEWNGKDKDGKLVPMGLYICYLEVTDPSSGKTKSAKAPIVVGVKMN